MNKHLTSPAIVVTVICCLGAVAAVLVASCSDQPSSFHLRVHHDPVGKQVEYTLTSQRVGSVFKNDELVEDFDTKMEGVVTYTTTDVLPNGLAIVVEKDIWSWDEKPKDSGQVKRVTKEYLYQMEVAPNGKVTNLRMEGDTSLTWANYVRCFSEQGVPIFPDHQVSPGYQWSQKSTAILADGEAVTVSTTYQIKGVAPKQGYQCAVIEYKGNMVLPLLPSAGDSTRLYGVDRIEMTGILYLIIDQGMPATSEERRRLVSERHLIKGGEEIFRRVESEEVISYTLVKIEGA